MARRSRSPRLSDLGERLCGVATECSKCGQRLLLQKPDRDVCARCELGRGGDYGAVVIETRKARPLVAPEPCTGCGRSTVDGEDTRLPLADGWCLSCRLDGVHLGAAGVA